MVEGAEFLAFLAFFDVVSTVSMHGQPIVSCSDDFGRHGSGSGVASARSIMDFLQHILGLLLGEAL